MTFPDRPPEPLEFEDIEILPCGSMNKKGKILGPAML
jgi:hypothetical protein